jgi:diguanylate cyclase (GGDEF)-like protein/PAS domain S-box-containing protein/putative nucleotidyltransferase with HDIG domain
MAGRYWEICRAGAAGQAVLRYLPALLVLGGGIAATLVVFNAVDAWDESNAQADFARVARTRVADIRRTLDPNLFMLQSLTSFYSASGAMNRDEFHEFVQPFLRRFGCVQAIAWAPRVYGAQRDALEEAVRNDGCPDFRMTEAAADGRLDWAARRDEYFPACLVEPYGGNTTVVGFDMASDPVRRAAMDRARDTGRMAATARVRLGPQAGRPWGILVFQPVYRRGAPVASVEDRRASLEGFAVTIFRMADLVESALAPRPSKDLHLSIYDASARRGERFLYYHRSRLAKAQPPSTGGRTGPQAEAAAQEEPEPPAGPSRTESFSVAGRRWEIITWPEGDLVDEAGDQYARTVLGGGLALSLLLAAWLAGSAARTAQIRKLASELGQAEVKFRTLVQLLPETVFELDERGRVTFANHNGLANFGYADEDVARGLECARLLAPQDRERAIADLGRALAGEKIAGVEYLALRQNGTTFPITVYSSPIVEDGRAVGIRGIAIDVTDRKKVEELLRQANSRLEELATTDELTGLWNRRRFAQMLKTEIDRARRRDAPLALVMFDIDQFKSVNDTYGHSFGDLVLREVAKTLQGGARSTDIVARYAGDEFMFLMPDTTIEAAVSAAERIRHRLDARRLSDGRRAVRVTISAGIGALEPGGPEAADGLVRQVDGALYAAKHAGRDCVRTWAQISRDPPAGPAVDAQAVEQLRRRVAALSRRSRELFVRGIRGLVHAQEGHDPYSKFHSENVAHYAACIARAMGMDAQHVETIYRAALVHDIGKIGVPDGILWKPGNLTSDERHLMQQHVTAGVRILDQMRFLEREIPIVRHHHERFDGHGYPDSVSGEAIPLGGRILAVADTLDALTADRPYRTARPVHEALQTIVEEAGRQFDPTVVDALLEWVCATRAGLGGDVDVTVANLLNHEPEGAAATS